MAMRPRPVTRPRQSRRPIYQDFQPHFELKEEQEAHVVQVHLPGFVKERVKITYVHLHGVIRVHGERPLEDNKWSRFSQTFPVQQNCDTSKIHGKFNNGILTVTIPKQVIAQTAAAVPVQEPPPKTAATTAEPKPHKVQEDPIPSKPSLTTPAGPPTNTSSETDAQRGREGISKTAAASAQGEQQRSKTSSQEAAAAASKAEKATFTVGDEKEMDDKKGGPPLAPPKGTAAETKAPKDKEDEVLPKPISLIQNEKQGEEKRLIPLTSPETGIGEPKSEEGDQDRKRGKASVESVYRKGVEDKDQKEANGKADAESKNAEEVVETNLHRERETDERSKEARAVLKILERGQNKSRGLGKPKKEDSTAANVMAAAKQRMKNLGNRMNDEEKQMLINMGAAVLVLMALGASVSYSFWSSGKDKN